MQLTPVVQPVIHARPDLELPERADIRVSYTATQGERTTFPVDAEFNHRVGDVQIIGIGNHKDGTSFVSYMVPWERTERFQHVVDAVPGPAGLGTTPHTPWPDPTHHIVTSRFRKPLEDIEEFELWTREIQTVTFRNVVLRPKER
jgi:hypothetical protein